MKLISTVKLQQCRDRLDISQRELARRSDRSPSTINQLESGHLASVTAQTAVNICEVLVVPVGELFVNDQLTPVHNSCACAHDSHAVNPSRDEGWR
jgi:transcriptional regulator with XRE-family HTH domain